MENLDSLKGTQNGMPAYRLLNANVSISTTGYHYIDYLDPVEEVCVEANSADALTHDEFHTLNVCFSHIQSGLMAMSTSLSNIFLQLPVEKSWILGVAVVYSWRDLNRKAQR